MERSIEPQFAFEVVPADFHFWVPPWKLYLLEERTRSSIMDTTDRTPECFHDITAELAGGNEYRPYQLTGTKAVIEDDECVPVRFDLTPNELRLESTCHDLLKTQPPPFRELVEYFRKPNLQCTQGLDHCKKWEKIIDKMFNIPEGVRETRCRCLKKMAKTDLLNMVDFRETCFDKSSLMGQYVGWHNRLYKRNKRLRPACEDEMCQAVLHERDVSMEVHKKTQTDCTLFKSWQNRNYTTRDTGVNVFNFVRKNHPGIDKHLDRYTLKKSKLQVEKLSLIIEGCMDENKDKTLMLKGPSYVKGKLKDFEIHFMFPMKCHCREVTMMDWYAGPQMILAAAQKTRMRDDKQESIHVVTIWDLENSTKNPERLYAFSSEIVNLEFSKRKPFTYLLVVCRNQELHVINTAKRTRLFIDPHRIRISRKIKATDTDVRHASWFNTVGKNSNRILCCKEDGSIIKYVVETKGKRLRLNYEPIPVFMKYTQIAKSMLPTFISGDARLNMSDNVYVIVKDGELHKISRTRRTVDHVYRLQHKITSFDFSPFIPQLLLTSTSAGSVQVWWENSHVPLTSFEREEMPVTKASWHPILSRFIISIVRTEIHAWEIGEYYRAEPKYIHTLPSKQVITDFQMSRDGLRWALSDERGQIFIFKMLVPKVSRKEQILGLCTIVLAWKPSVSDYITSLITEQSKLNSNCSIDSQHSDQSEKTIENTDSISCKSITTIFHEKLAKIANRRNEENENWIDAMSTTSFPIEVSDEPLKPTVEYKTKYTFKENLIIKKTCVKFEGTTPELIQRLLVKKPYNILTGAPKSKKEKKKRKKAKRKGGNERKV